MLTDRVMYRADEVATRLLRTANHNHISVSDRTDRPTETAVVHLSSTTIIINIHVTVDQSSREESDALRRDD